MRTRSILCLFVFSIPFASVAQKEFQKKYQAEFIDSENGSVIEIPAGTFSLDASLWMDGKEDITIRGAGIDKTILSFKNQISGAEGIKITNSKRITLEEMTVQDSKGDAVKAQLVDGITIRKVKAEWTGGPKSTNGSYALYPVQCNQVLIEYCTAIGASDAGIYVGQSNYIIVRNSVAYHNVAGIEIENSKYAEVYDNEAYNNTGGVLIFDLPDLIQKEGGYVRVFNNYIHDNNLNNFAPKGNIVGKVPPGTGTMILATRNVEIFENRIINNITVGAAIVSYYITENPIKDDSYNPYPSNIFIHNNTFERPRVKATSKGRMGKMYRFKLRFGKNVPHILYDGIEDEKMKDRKICIQNNTNQTFVNIDAGNGFKNKSRDSTNYVCSLDPLPRQARMGDD